MWVKFDSFIMEELPPEGEEVLVSDGCYYDVCYFVKSGEYKWMKVDLINDDVFDFKAFIPTKWKKIN